MTELIPPDYIQELLLRVDIVDVIGNRVKLKKVGGEFHGICPFHDEKTPSFTVQPQKQFYHCFGCGANGNALTFITEYDNVHFREAVDTLSRQVGMQIPPSAHDHDPGNNTDYSLIKKIHSQLDAANTLFQKHLRSHTTKSTAVNYLKGRNITGEIALKFGIGYAPNEWHALREIAPSDKQYKSLEISGLLTSRDDGNLYDKFRDRIMFPIRNKKGHLIGFGGRSIGKNTTPKYLNSPETQVFKKGNELYGLFEALQNKPSRLLVVEGFLDVIPLHQYGIDYAVAPLGTAITTHQLTTLMRSSNETIFCFDGDKAGRKAAWRVVPIIFECIKEDKDFKFLFLPEGEDPDTMIQKHGAETFEQKINNESVPFANYFIDHLKQDVNTQSPSGQTEIISRAKKVLKNANDSIIRDVCINELAKLVSMDIDHITRLIFEEKPKKQYQRKTGYQNKARYKMKPGDFDKSVKMTPMRIAIAFIIHNPQEAVNLKEIEKLRSLKVSGIDLLLDLIDSFSQNPQLTFMMYLLKWEGSAIARQLINMAKRQSSDDEYKYTDQLNNALNAIYNKGIQEKITELENASKIRQLTNNEILKLMDLLSQNDESLVFI